MVILPLTFISNVFVPIGTLPDWLQPVAAWNPVSTLTASLRELWGNPNPFPASGLPADYPVAVTLGWMVVLLADLRALRGAPLPLHQRLNGPTPAGPISVVPAASVRRPRSRWPALARLRCGLRGRWRFRHPR